MPCENLTLIISIHSEVTHPLLRLLLIGSTFKPLGQRQDEERERIFVRPPLPGHESRGTTGVTTPDNQRGILNFHKVKASKKMILLFGENHQLRLCKSQSLPLRSFTAEVASTVPTDRHEAAAARLTVSVLSRFEIRSNGQQTVLLTLQGPNVCGDTGRTENGGGG